MSGESQQATLPRLQGRALALDEEDRRDDVPLAEQAARQLEGDRAAETASDEDDGGIRGRFDDSANVFNQPKRQRTHVLERVISRGRLAPAQGQEAPLAPVPLGLLGWIYLSVALLLDAWFVWHAVRVLRERTQAAARSLFHVSLVYLFALFLAMLLDRLLL